MEQGKVIYFAGGCFWGVEHFFKGVDGVRECVPGYANGRTENPSYEEVYTDTTGHAETVKVSYDPARVSIQTLLRLFFTIIDPMALNRQGHDTGTRYRTGVFYAAAEDRPVIEDAFRQVEAKLGRKTVTELEPLRCFFPAEEYHQDYLGKHPDGYCHLPFKSFRYLRLWQDVALSLGEEPDQVARMANAAALISERMKFFWTGFYRVSGDVLVLGPFQGTAACLRIPYGKGVCGTAVVRDETLLVPDVHEFPGHIACDGASESEIVIPIHEGGQVRAVLDIDSPVKNRFSPEDRDGLVRLVRMIEEKVSWI